MENWGYPDFGNFGKMENLHIKTDENWWTFAIFYLLFLENSSPHVVAPGVRRKVIHRRRDCCKQLRYVASICHVSWCSHVHFEDDLGNWGVSFSVSSLAKLFPATLSKWTRRERRSRKAPASPLMVCLTRWKTMMVGSENPWENHLKIRRSVALEIGIQCTPKSNRFSSFHAQALTHPGFGRPDYGVWRSRAEVFFAPSLWVPNLFKLLNHALLIPKILPEQFHSSLWPPNLFGSSPTVFTSCDVFSSMKKLHRISPLIPRDSGFRSTPALRPLVPCPDCHRSFKAESLDPRPPFEVWSTVKHCEAAANPMDGRMVSIVLVNISK